MTNVHDRQTSLIPTHQWTDSQTHELILTISRHEKYRDLFFPQPTTSSSSSLTNLTTDPSSTSTTSDRKNEYERELCLDVLDGTDWMNSMIEIAKISEIDDGNDNTEKRVFKVTDEWTGRANPVGEILLWMEFEFEKIHVKLGNYPSQQAVPQDETRILQRWSRYMRKSKYDWFFPYLEIKLKQREKVRCDTDSDTPLASIDDIEERPSESSDSACETPIQSNKNQRQVIPRVSTGRKRPAEELSTGDVDVPAEGRQKRKHKRHMCSKHRSRRSKHSSSGTPNLGDSSVGRTLNEAIVVDDDDDDDSSSEDAALRTNQSRTETPHVGTDTISPQPDRCSDDSRASKATRRLFPVIVISDDEEVDNLLGDIANEIASGRFDVQDGDSDTAERSQDEDEDENGTNFHTARTTASPNPTSTSGSADHSASVESPTLASGLGLGLEQRSESDMEIDNDDQSDMEIDDEAESDVEIIGISSRQPPPLSREPSVRPIRTPTPPPLIERLTRGEANARRLASLQARQGRFSHNRNPIERSPSVCTDSENDDQEIHFPTLELDPMGLEGIIPTSEQNLSTMFAYVAGSPMSSRRSVRHSSVFSTTSVISRHPRGHTVQTDGWSLNFDVEVEAADLISLETPGGSTHRPIDSHSHNGLLLQFEEDTDSNHHHEYNDYRNIHRRQSTTSMARLSPIPDTTPLPDQEPPSEIPYSRPDTPPLPPEGFPPTPLRHSRSWSPIIIDEQSKITDSRHPRVSLSPSRPPTPELPSSPVKAPGHFSRIPSPIPALQALQRSPSPVEPTMTSSVGSSAKRTYDASHDDGYSYDDNDDVYDPRGESPFTRRSVSPEYREPDIQDNFVDRRDVDAGQQSPARNAVNKGTRSPMTVATPMRQAISPILPQAKVRVEELGQKQIVTVPVDKKKKKKKEKKEKKKQNSGIPHKLWVNLTSNLSQPAQKAKGEELRKSKLADRLHSEKTTSRATDLSSTTTVSNEGSNGFAARLKSGPSATIQPGTSSNPLSLSALGLQRSVSDGRSDSSVVVPAGTASDLSTLVERLKGSTSTSPSHDTLAGDQSKSRMIPTKLPLIQRMKASTSVQENGQAIAAAEHTRTVDSETNNTFLHKLRAGKSAMDSPVFDDAESMPPPAFPKVSGSTRTGNGPMERNPGNRISMTTVQGEAATVPLSNETPMTIPTIPFGFRLSASSSQESKVEGNLNHIFRDPVAGGRSDGSSHESRTPSLRPTANGHANASTRMASRLLGMLMRDVMERHSNCLDGYEFAFHPSPIPLKRQLERLVTSVGGRLDDGNQDHLLTSNNRTRYKKERKFLVIPDINERQSLQPQPDNKTNLVDAFGLIDLVGARMSAARERDQSNLSLNNLMVPPIHTQAKAHTLIVGPHVSVYTTWTSSSSSDSPTFVSQTIPTMSHIIHNSSNNRSTQNQQASISLMDRIS